MTRKDFILIADVIRNLEALSTPEDVANAFAKALKQTNSAFKPDLFVRAATGQCKLTARV